jgi:hypothetical protein
MALQTKSKTQSKSGSNSDLTAKQSFTAAMKYCNGEVFGRTGDERFPCVSNPRVEEILMQWMLWGRSI